MSKKCAKCRVPITGFWSIFPRVFGVKKSIKDPELCNKCDGSEPAAVKPEEKIAEPPTVDLMDKPADEVMTKPEDEVMEKPEDDLMKK
jgi:hypothetical protein